MQPQACAMARKQIVRGLFQTSTKLLLARHDLEYWGIESTGTRRVSYLPSRFETVLIRYGATMISSVNSPYDSSVGNSLNNSTNSKDSNPPDMSEVDRLQKVLKQLSKQLKEAEKVAAQSPAAHGQMMMLASQIASIQNDITSMTNVGSSISSAGKAQAALNENTRSPKTAAPSAQAPTEAAMQPALTQSKPLRLDMTGAFIDTVALEARCEITGCLRFGEAAPRTGSRAGLS